MPGDHLPRPPRSKVLPRAWRAWMAALALGAAGAAQGEAPPPGSAITEQLAIEHALARPLLRDADAARLAAAESAVTASATPPNPVVSLEHERIDGAEGSGSESSVMLSQTFDLAGKRALHTQAAENRVDATRLDIQSRRLALVQDVRRAFAETLYRQRLREAHEAWLQRIASALTAVGHLADAGEASGYDRRRLAREVHSAEARLRSVEAEASRSRELLAGLMARPLAAEQPLAGDLLPAPPPPLDALLAAAERHPELASLAAQAAASEREREAAMRLKTPDITLGIGAKHVREPGFSDNGLLLALSLPLPTADRGQAAEQQARAQAAALQAERSLKHARIEAELRGWWREAAQLRHAALSFQADALTASQALSRIAEAAYRAGEGSLLELLDAYRAELEAQTMTLDLALRARLSRIELDALSGATPHE